MTRTVLRDRMLPGYSISEERLNMVTHIVGGGFGIALLTISVIMAALRSNAIGVLAAIIYGLSVTVLYTVSSVYHGLRPGIAKKVMQIIDHCAIYFMIAGTYTPILACSVVRTDKLAAWITFGVVWGLAFLAATLTAIDLKSNEKLSMICYIVMGWAVLFIIPQIVSALTLPGALWLFGGGLFYTVGAILYGIGKKKRYMHGVFHIFVLLGSFSHAVVVLYYVYV